MPKTAVVMSGGGAKGSFEVGVLKYLSDQGLEADCFYGTSVGALNAIGMAKIGISGLLEVWANIKKFSDVLRFNWRSLGPLFGYGTFNTRPLRTIIDRVLAVPGQLANATVAYVDLESGSTLHGALGDPDFGDAVEASAAQPVIMTALKRRFVDGGVRDVTPLKKAIDDGAERIVVILASPLDYNPSAWKLPAVVWYKPWTWVQRSLSMLYRTIEVMNQEVFVQDIKSCLWRNKIGSYRRIQLEIYAPAAGNELDTFGFNQDNISRGIAQGLAAAERGPLKL